MYTLKFTLNRLVISPYSQCLFNCTDRDFFRLVFTVIFQYEWHVTKIFRFVRIASSLASEKRLFALATSSLIVRTKISFV